MESTRRIQYVFTTLLLHDSRAIDVERQSEGSLIEKDPENVTGRLE